MRLRKLHNIQYISECLILRLFSACQWTLLKKKGRKLTIKILGRADRGNMHHKPPVLLIMEHNMKFFLIIIIFSQPVILLKIFAYSHTSFN